jgi:hypothetical protein
MALVMKAFIRGIHITMPKFLSACSFIDGPLSVPVPEFPEDLMTESVVDPNGWWITGVYPPLSEELLLGEWRVYEEQVHDPMIYLQADS